jgi:hypothetical protein
VIVVLYGEPEPRRCRDCDKADEKRAHSITDCRRRHRR